MAKAAQGKSAHRHHNIAVFLATVEAICRDKQERLTPIRARVLELLLQSATPLTAYDLVERMSASGKRFQAPTIYRALDFLSENGFIHKLESLAAFIPCHHPAERHNEQLLICRGCRKVEELSDDGVHDLIAKRAKASGFAAQRQIVEIVGMCASCAAKEARA